MNNYKNHYDTIKINQIHTIERKLSIKEIDLKAENKKNLSNENIKDYYINVGKLEIISEILEYIKTDTEKFLKLYNAI